MRHKVHHIHFVGIGGAGMSGIAEVLLNLGYEVTGSDLNTNAATERLAGLGALIRQGHHAHHVEGADVVVVSTAVAKNNPEVVRAREQRIPVVPRAMMLAELMRLKKGIAVAGTHGKTTTTSLIASILAEADLDPTFVIGGKLNSAGAHAALGKGEFIVAEADESDASFLFLQPVISVVTNIDQDHMETYDHDFEKLKDAFIQFLDHLPFYGVAVLCLEDPVVKELLTRIEKPVVTYGFSDEAMIQAVDVKANQGQMSFGVLLKPNRVRQETRRLSVVLNLPGHHNVLNALAAIAVALEVGASTPSIIKALEKFTGVGRRFQRYGVRILPQHKGLFDLVDDYGHHPVEMKATLEAARGAYPHRRIVLAFQPHRYSRTRDCFEDFVEVLSQADGVILCDIYPAGESPLTGIDSDHLAQALERKKIHQKPLRHSDLATLAQVSLDYLQDRDVLITMGAGSIGLLPQQLMKLTEEFMTS
ncbi:MAG: UDP-N-acetylmuramate--L-alanine ligase [Ferrovum sp. 37-45-19]|uniref:UDP-N-acetylmuramate--L-alanine ligase n=1 Tax=Ferrovum sp. JA12 TaxID=1356299 RepID=UPI0007030B2C|nr:UDP-N-acetylmuramate--L-alanine ligase [Ferrovum sp. JA12]OYV80649.1 MAG: UDP-N-acetylmuramate--L-alanine ligase [Ferrovum sp. 21-44-67]OYV95200.1 MAG: UDP-N-acetylmuramate--L-alanine ligase [Ferrovum sp. 37-45-19]OZB33779.1 MAG: UDP-N-acetylmuramate--L-alanine ligase [Ferrovum sp. 34-44-207]HQT80701.1 UDP-N-acetylmuramate--L-alanine ligase [Ferrovaceae bacterium]KRH79794.1 UDP-N-acetylmuramate--L-alanine ligase [Ferrovum sp. JA12]